MRYKVVKETHICDDKPVSSYYVMYEKKVWWKKEPVWRYCKKFDYSYGTFSGGLIKKENLVEAEDYIKLQMRIDNNEFEPEDIKIYECRDTKLDKILK